VQQLFGALPLFELRDGEDIEIVGDTEMVRDGGGTREMYSIWKRGRWIDYVSSIFFLFGAYCLMV
jgi:hypothetical protein